MARRRGLRSSNTYGDTLTAVVRGPDGEIKQQADSRNGRGRTGMLRQLFALPSDMGRLIRRLVERTDGGILTVRGQIEAVVFGPDGKPRQRVVTNNLIVTVGDNKIAEMLAEETADQLQGMNLGTSSQAAAKGDTGLIAQTANSYEPMDSGYPKVKVGDDDVVQSRCTWVAGDVTQNGIQEVGLWTAGTNGGNPTGVLYSRGILSPAVNKGANDSLQVTWEWDVTGS